MEAKSNKDKLLGLIRNYYTAPKVSRGNVDLEPILKIFHSIYFHIYYLKYYFNCMLTKYLCNLYGNKSSTRKEKSFTLINVKETKTFFAIDFMINIKRLLS